MTEYKGVVSHVKDEQRLLNTMASESILSIEARVEFEKYYSEFRFGFGSNWMKPIFKTYFWWGYFAGYKKGVYRE